MPVSAFKDYVDGSTPSGSSAYEKRGIAVSDLLGMIANGVETIHRTTEERDYARIAELIAEQ